LSVTAFSILLTLLIIAASGVYLIEHNIHSSKSLAVFPILCGGRGQR
jgi:hypothetical protein